MAAPSFLSKNVVAVNSDKVMYAAQLENSAIAARGRVAGATAAKEEERQREEERRRKQAELLRHVPAGGGGQLRQADPTGGTAVATRLHEAAGLTSLVKAQVS